MTCFNCDTRTDFQKLLHLLGKLISFATSYLLAVYTTIFIIGFVAFIVDQGKHKEIKSLKAKIELLELGIQVPTE